VWTIGKAPDELSSGKTATELKPKRRLGGFSTPRRASGEALLKAEAASDLPERLPLSASLIPTGGCVIDRTSLAVGTHVQSKVRPVNITNVVHTFLGALCLAYPRLI
jgi:hypothetical protein